MTYMMEDSRTIPSVLTALFCARSIERIGDRCQNICEFIFYYVKGQDFRHVGGDELDKLLAEKIATNTHQTNPNNLIIGICYI